MNITDNKGGTDFGVAFKEMLSQSHRDKMTHHTIVITDANVPDDVIIREALDKVKLAVTPLLENDPASVQMLYKLLAKEMQHMHVVVIDSGIESFKLELDKRNAALSSLDVGGNELSLREVADLSGKMIDAMNLELQKHSNGIVFLKV